jgi:hypothetical protein
MEYLARELSKHVDLTVHCQGADRGGTPTAGPAEVRQPCAPDDLDDIMREGNRFLERAFGVTEPRVEITP